MHDGLELAVRAALIGIGATATMDVWAILLRTLFGVRSLDFRMLGRWIGHLPRGRFMHANVADAPPVRGEAIVGWCAHYLIGITFAVLLLALWGVEWARAPSLLPALLIGIATVVAPYFILQPAMGAGILGSKTPRPNSTRLRSLVTHTVYGFGLYGAALLCSRLFP